MLVCIFTLSLGMLFTSVESDRLDDYPDQELETGYLLQIAEESLQSDLDRAAEYAERAEKLAAALKLDYEIGLALKIKGNIHFIRGEMEPALNYYSSALAPAHESSDNKLLGDLYYNLGRSYTNTGSYSSALENLHKSLSYRQDLPTREDESSSLNSIGLIYWEQQEYQQAIHFFQAAAEMTDQTQHPKLSAAIFNNLGNALLKSGDTAAAGEAYIISLRIKETYGDDNELAAANTNLGNLYYTATDYVKAIAYYEKALELYSTIGDTINAAQVKANLGSTYNDLNRTETALTYNQEALDIFVTYNMLREQSRVLNNLGNTYLRRREFSEALSYYYEAISIKERLNDYEGIATTHNNISELLILSGDLTEALLNAEKSYEYSLLINDQKMQLNNLRQFAIIYEEQGDYRRAVEAYKDYIELDLDVYAIEKKDVIAEMMVRFETEKKTEEIFVLKTQQQIQEEKIAQQIRAKLRILYLTLAIGAVALSLALLYRAKQKEVKKRRQVQKELETLNQELETKINKAVADYQKHQQIIAQKSKLESLGNFAAGIAHEINQPLSAISMSIDNIQNKVKLGLLSNDYLTNKCSNTQEDILRIRKIIEHVRLFSRNQNDSLVEQIELNEVVKSAVSLIHHTISKSGIDLELRLIKSELPISGDRYKLEQVLLNLVSNAKDAIEEKAAAGSESNHKKSIRISTKIKEKQAVIEITDNGTGIPKEIIDKIYDPFFTTKTPDKGTGLGLSISYGIIREMDGEISVRSEVNLFTEITICFALLKEF
jgi:signal transduction histidine kinase/lipopolysaccharide biosynthesis regulator YciM